MEEVERIQVDSGKLLLVSGMATGALFGIIFAIVGATKMINMVGKYAYALSPVFSLILAFVGGFGSRSSVRAGNGPDASDLQSYGLIGLLTIFLFALVAVAKLLGPYFSVTRMVKRFKPKKVEKKEEPKPTFVRKVKEIQKKQNQDNDEDTASVESDDEFESD
jgi:predicted membrane protein